MTRTRPAHGSGLLRRLLACAAVVAAAFGSSALVAQEKIIVSGASGQLGGLAVEELLALGVAPENLILVSRTPESLERYARMGASTRFGDFTMPESLPAAYAGGDRMLLVSIGGTSTGIPRPELHNNAIRAARDAGVSHIAYTSWIAISGGETGGIAGDHVRTEELLRASGVAWTMLRNSVYADGLPQQAAGMLAAGRVEVDPSETGTAYVTRRDCAAAAAAVLARPGHENKVYDITGPALIGAREIAEAAMAVTDRHIEIVETPGAGGRFGGAGMARASTHVADVTGRPATGIRALLEEHRDMLMAASE